MAIPVLRTTRYTEIGTYIGQFFLPGAGSLSNESRIVCIVAKGDRLIKIPNNILTRAFVYAEPMTFSSIAPYVADLEFAANGDQALPIRLFTADGIEIQNNKWQFVEVLGELTRIQILDSEYDPLASYFLDYQSTDRNVLDPIPVITIQSLSAQAEIRQIQTVSTIQDQDEFQEYVDFFGPFEVDAVTADVGNAFTSTDFTAVETTGVTGTGTTAVAGISAYTSNYNRLYRLECMAASGLVGSRLATLEWTAAPQSAGNSSLPPTPLNVAETPPTLSLDETVPASFTGVILELGIAVDFTFGVANFNVGDVFYFQANGAGLIELDPTLLNTNQFTSFSAVTASLVGISTGDVDVATPGTYSFTDYNTSYRLKVISVTGTFGGGNRTATFVWAGFGGRFLDGTFTVSQLVPASLTQTLSTSGIQLNFDFGGTHYVVGDTFNFSVSAPRKFYKGKESLRNLNLTVGTVVYPGNDQATYTGGYVADTAEGGFGNWAADSATSQGLFELTDGLRFFVRNSYENVLATPVPGGSRVAVADLYLTQAKFMGVLDFSLNREETQLFSNPAEVARDVTGTVTGVVGASYIIANEIPVSIITLKKVSDSNDVAFIQVPGTRYLRITESGFNSSFGDLVLIYRWAGPEPRPGDGYFMTATYLRPDAFYNKPLLFLQKQDAFAFLAPKGIRNDALIGADIAFDYALPGLFVIQVKDTDDDSVYTRDDFRIALQSYLFDRRSTDLVVLNNFGSLGDQLGMVNRANDPFERHETLTFVGTPIGTPIGSDTELGSLVFLAKKTLAVYGQSPAHGSRILVASTRATRTITQETGTSVEVTLDGSFIALALAALQSSFTSPTDTVLLKTLISFSTMQTYSEPENALLGNAHIIFFKDEGNGIMRIYEDVTVDPFTSDTLNLNQMTQKQHVTRVIRTAVNASLISLVSPNAGSAINAITGLIAGQLRALEADGKIGNYQDASGTVRGIDSSTDVFVFQDQTDPTLYNIGYNYFLATVIKRVFGLFTVNLPGGFPTKG